MISDVTRDRLLSERGASHPNLSSNAAESADKPAKGADLGGPTGGTLERLELAGFSAIHDARR